MRKAVGANTGRLGGSEYPSRFFYWRDWRQAGMVSIFFPDVTSTGVWLYTQGSNS